MQIGAHTNSHPILARLDSAQAEEEIAASKRTLEGILGRRVSLFAYPNGRPGRDYAEKDVAIVRRLGFDAAVSTRPAAAGRQDDPFELPRFTPWDRSMLRFGLRMVRNLATT
jgi:peptidoglycan/xylan/chitin deacetylase (PgdA/CDA1 family)